MAHPFARHNESDAGKARAKHLMKGYARGGKAHGDEAEDRALFKKMMKQHEKEEMKVEGRASGGRLDKFARGGKAKHHKGTNVNIAIVNPGQKSDAAPKMPMPAGPPLPPPGLPPGGPPPMMPPPKPPMGGGLPPGMMPPMQRGGRAYAKGGKVPMTAGADSGEGRLQKIKAYGKRARG